MTPFDQARASKSTSSHENWPHLRLHLPYNHVTTTFGDDWFALKAESFARFFGTPTFLISQTRQADRDKALADADARHREDIAKSAEQRQLQMAEHAAQMTALLQQNTELTEITRQLSARIEALTLEMHAKVLSAK